MTEKESHVHGFIFKHDEGNHHINSLVERWNTHMQPREIEHMLHEAKHSPDGKLHLNDGKTTLIHNDDGSYSLHERHL